MNGDSLPVTKAAVLEQICWLILEADDSQSLVISTISPMQHCKSLNTFNMSFVDT